MKKNLLNYSCSIINISINTPEINLCTRGEIGRHIGFKTLKDRIYYRR